jgi:hypothetical protein
MKKIISVSSLQGQSTDRSAYKATLVVRLLNKTTLQTCVKKRVAVCAVQNVQD